MGILMYTADYYFIKNYHKERTMYTADYFIEHLGLSPHVEGGYYREVFRGNETIVRAGGDGSSAKRNVATTIYFLLPGSAVSRFHRLTSDEIWFFHYGCPLTIHTINYENGYKAHTLGLNCEEGILPQVTISANTIFGAETVDKEAFSLVSCMVAPGFDFADFEMFETKALCAMFPAQRELFERF